MNELISIIIPIYNSEKYLEKCIKSVIIQTYTNLEIILINDGSLNICNRYAVNDNRIKIIDKQNEGVSKARNMGIKFANGIYIFFLDSDDWIEKDWIYNLYKN